MLTVHYTYNQIEEMLTGSGWSIRQTVDPLVLHKDGKFYHRFTSKRSLIDHINAVL